MTKIELTKKERMIIYNCLKSICDGISKRYYTLLDFDTGKFFKEFRNLKGGNKNGICNNRTRWRWGGIYNSHR
jgi:hypothetical protein